MFRNPCGRPQAVKYLLWTQRSSGAAFALQGAHGRVQEKGRAAGQCFPDDLMRSCVPAVPQLMVPMARKIPTALCVLLFDSGVSFSS